MRIPFFSFYVFLFQWKTERFDLSARGAANANDSLVRFFTETVMHYIIIIIPIFNFICMFCKKQRNNNGDCRRREMSRCYGTHIALDRASGFRSAFLQRTAKWHWLLVCIVIHSSNGFIVRNAIHFAAQKIILFHLEWRFVSCRFCRMNSVNLRI